MSFFSASPNVQSVTSAHRASNPLPHPRHNPFRFAHKALGFLSLFIAGLLGSCGLFNSAQPDNPESFAFAWITDTHIVTTETADKDGDRTERLQSTLAAISARKDIAFVVHGGDFIDAVADPRQLDAASAVMKPSTPWYPIAGNHDIDNAPDSAKIALWISKGMGRGASNREYYGFQYGAAAFFIINTFASESKDPAVRQRAEDQLKEMDEFFAVHASARHKFVCGHAPLFVKSADEKDEYFNIKTPYRQKLLALMNRHNISTYLSGHRHLMDKVTDPSNGITVFSQPTLSYPIGGSRTGYCIFTVSPSGLQRDFFPVETSASPSPSSQTTTAPLK